MIGVKTIRTALTDLESKIAEKIKIPTEEWLGPKAVIDKIVKSLKEIIKISGVIFYPDFHFLWWDMQN